MSGTFHAFGKQHKGTDRYLPCSSAAVPLIAEIASPASIEIGSGMLPNAAPPTVITFKIGDAYLGIIVSLCMISCNKVLVSATEE